jgi:3-dehydroquinate dehydratase-2
MEHEAIMKILIINGPNLNLLGKRKPTIYGQKSLEEVNNFVKEYFKKIDVSFFQSNHEGEIIDKIHEAEKTYAGIVLNAGAFTHYSYAIRDAIEAISIPVVEVHISNIAQREEFRHKSVISDVVEGSIMGLGIYGYVLGVQALAHEHKRKQ